MQLTLPQRAHTPQKWRKRQRSTLPPTPARAPRREKRQQREDESEEEEIAVLKVILDFFEAHPEFYDLGHRGYKDEKRKDRELDALATTLGPEWTVSKIKTRFKSFRRDYVKFKKKIKTAKSKSGASLMRLTRLQQYKMQRGQFLDAYCRSSDLGQEMGPQLTRETVTDSEVESHVDPLEEADDSLNLPSSERAPSLTRSTGNQGSRSSRKRAKDHSVVGLLETIYTETRSAQKEVMQKMSAMSGRGKDDVRDSWAEYLTSITYRVPEENFTQRQSETFALSLRLGGRPAAPEALCASPAALGALPAALGAPPATLGAPPFDFYRFTSRVPQTTWKLPGPSTWQPQPSNQPQPYQQPQPSNQPQPYQQPQPSHQPQTYQISQQQQPGFMTMMGGDTYTQQAPHVNHNIVHMGPPRRLSAPAHKASSTWSAVPITTSSPSVPIASIPLVSNYDPNSPPNLGSSLHFSQITSLSQLEEAATTVLQGQEATVGH